MSNIFKPGDLVRIAKQPPRLFFQLEGLRGYIRDISGDTAHFEALLPTQGCGGIPLSCLEQDDGADLAAAYVEQQALIQRIVDDATARGARYEKFLAQIAADHGISVAMVRSIERALDEWES